MLQPLLSNCKLRLPSDKKALYNRELVKKYGQYCPMAHALDLVGERWSLLIVRELLEEGPLRYTDLHCRLSGCGTNILAARLKQLEQGGIVQRRQLPPPAASTVYELTGYGEALRPVHARARPLGRSLARAPGRRRARSSPGWLAGRAAHRPSPRRRRASSSASATRSRHVADGESFAGPGDGSGCGRRGRRRRVLRPARRPRPRRGRGARKQGRGRGRCSTTLPPRTPACPRAAARRRLLTEQRPQQLLERLEVGPALVAPQRVRRQRLLAEHAVAPDVDDRPDRLLARRTRA